MPNELTKRLCYSQFQSNELYHHGILGMHWGEKNGPPYPLSAEVNKAVKKTTSRFGLFATYKEQCDR